MLGDNRDTSATVTGCDALRCKIRLWISPASISMGLHQALDASRIDGVARVQPFEDRPPHRHVARAVSGRREPPLSFDESFHCRHGKSAAVTLGERRQVRRLHFQRVRRVPVALAISPVTRSAVELEEIYGPPSI